MVRLYAANIKELPNPMENSMLLDVISNERKQKIIKYLKVQDKKRCLGAGLLLNKVLPLYGVLPNAVRIREDGKPELDGVFFNLSHSGNIVICAVSKKEVGCDIEKIEKAPEGVAERFFCPKETAYIQAAMESERDSRFFRIWTMKESYVKMTGEGMNLSFECFEFLLDSKNIKVCRKGNMLSCHIMEYDIPGYKTTVCAEEGDFLGKVEYIDIVKQFENNKIR